MPFTEKDGHLTKAFQKEKRDTASQLLKKICEQKLESSLLKYILEKLKNSILFGIVDIAQLDRAVIAQFSGVARSRYLNMR